jgi:dimethylglycine catabolism A
MTVSAFDPLDVGPLSLPNRIAVPAMVTRLSSDDGLVTDDVVDRYRRFAEGGAGLIVVEASSIHGGRSGALLKISSDEFIPGLARLASACHQAGPVKVFVKIIHFLKVARSGWRQLVSDLETSELEALPALFADAAERAAEAGLDGVELHMAHAHTLSSMLPRRNRCRDHYGRTLENRLRLPSMVLAAVRERVGDYPVGVRFDADESIKRGYSVDDAAAFAVRFAELGVDYVPLSAGGKFEDAVHREGSPLYPYTGFSGDRCMPCVSYPAAVNVWMARCVRSELRRAGHDTPVISAGKIGSVALADDVLAEGSPYERLTSCPRTRQLDQSALTDHSYTYRAVPYDRSGKRGRPSNIREVDLEADHRDQPARSDQEAS